MSVEKAKEVFEYLDRMFSGDTESFEVRASEWRVLREYLEPLRDPLPTMEAAKARGKALRDTGVKLSASDGPRYLSIDGWVGHVALRLGFVEIPEQIRRQLTRLANLGYTDRAAEHYMRKALCLGEL